MSALTPLFAASLAVATALAWIAVRAPAALPARLGVVALAALFLPLSHAALEGLLGRPRPATPEGLGSLAGPAATVLASSLDEGRRIYLWLRPEGDAEPRAYELPWDRELAEQLQEAGRDAAARGTALRARLAREGDGPPDGEDEPMFYAEPQPATPEKAEPPPAAATVLPGPG
jgi:hypothetical protein